MPVVLPFATAAAAIARTTYTISRGQSAKKKAKGQAEQAERVRADEKKKAEELAARAEAIPEKAKERAAVAAGLKKRRRATIATGPRGLFDEPTVGKPTLLGEG